MHIAHTQAQQANTNESENHRALQQEGTTGQPTPKDFAGLLSVNPKRLHKKARLIEHNSGQESNWKRFLKP
jgi:hypothetical protein